MAPEPDLVFPPFRLDVSNEQVWCGTHLVPLRPKTFAVLRYLAAHAQRLVTQAELLQAVWSGAYVSEGLLRGYIRELRAVLGDEAKAPRFIATVARRGWRFIAPVTLTDPSETMAAFSSSPRPLVPSLPPLVGREAELEQLSCWLERALRGERQVVFVTGEAGIGKTSLVEAFLARVTAELRLCMARGQCVEHYGAGEAYLPVLEALGRLCRTPGGEHLIALLRQQAPTWLVQFPWLLSEADREALQRELLGATRGRMLREFTEAIEALTAESPQVLVLEDLHWSDYATLDLVSWLARRQEPARLLLIGTYRPVEAIMRGHPLRAAKAELQLHGQCQELVLEGLSVRAVEKYLAARCPGLPLPEELTQLLHQRTDGHPLFLANLVEEWVVRGVLREVEGRWTLSAEPEAVEVGVPESIRQLIEQQLEQLTPEEQRVLGAGSVAGVEFAAAVVAAALAEDVIQVEARCEGLARRQQFLRPLGVAAWPDGTVMARYSFRHALYQNAVYQCLGAAQRVQLHQRVGEHLEGAYGPRGGEIAAELAVHFERGRDHGRAVQYLQQAAENASRRHAHREVVTALRRALRLLKELPDSPEGARQELDLQTTLGPALMAVHGWASPEVGTAYARARELCREVGETPQLFPVLMGLRVFYHLRGEFRTARQLAEQCLSLAQRQQDPALLLAAHYTLAPTLYCLGELVQARRHLEAGLALYDPQQQRSLAFRYGQDPGVCCQAYMAWVLWGLGYPDQALQMSDKALILARELAHPHSLAYALFYRAALHQFRRERQATQEQAEALMVFAAEQGFGFWRARGAMLRGWALAKRCPESVEEQRQAEEGMAEMHSGLAAYLATGADLLRPYWLSLLAEVDGTGGQVEEALRALAEAQAVVQNNGECWWEAELYRLKGELLLKLRSPTLPPSIPLSSLEECFCQALDIAHRQQAKSLELRATVSLSRLWREQGKQAAARQLLAEIYGWFTEGFDTVDLQEARALLAELA